MSKPGVCEKPQGQIVDVRGPFNIATTGAPHVYGAKIPGSSVQESVSLDTGKYRLRIAQSLAEREAAWRLRFRVFNLELGEGLSSSYSTGMDQDEFDLFCDHLIVSDRLNNEVVGTYRMQSGTMANFNIGFYSAREFDFSPYECVAEEVLELGRASVDSAHRSSEVLNLLWRGIVRYAQFYGLRYLLGCSSLNSQDPQQGWSIFGQLSPFLVSSELQTLPAKAYKLPEPACVLNETAKVPKLLRTYIGVGAKICGEPAWDMEFGTIDFLTLLDLSQLTPAARSRFMGEPN